MPAVTHPRIPAYTIEVADADLPRWTAQGWVGPTSDPAPTTTPKPRQPRGRRTRKEK